MLSVIRALERQPPRRLFVASALLLALIAWVDDVTGYELTLTAAYLLPVLLVAWAGSRRAGLVISTAATLSWAAADFLSGHRYSRPFFLYWAVGVRFVSFTIFVLMLSELKRALHRERDLARTDALTSLGNRMAFCERLAQEIERSRRYGREFSVAYFDCDNFKAVNDTQGHRAGDALLRSVGSVLHDELRATDFAARLGGDEFAVILTETPAEPATRTVQLIEARLLTAMRDHGWPVTFSVGLAAYRAPDGDVDAVLHEVDQLMYEAKRSGKGSVKRRGPAPAGVVASKTLD
jgi:diguanylate cyclase (GGDEF)-like protein